METKFKNIWNIWYHNSKDDWTINGYKKLYTIENIKDILFLMVGFSRYRWFWKNRFALGLLVNRSMPSHVISLVKANSDEYLVRSDFVTTTNPSIYVLKWEIITSN